MSKKYPIINPNASCVIGMYVNELVGMDHPIASMRFTSGMKANLCYQQAIPLKDAIESILGHVRYLFGDDIPDELVIITVSLVYAEASALHPITVEPTRSIDKDCEYVFTWLSHSRNTRGTVDIKEHKDWPIYPSASISGMGPVAWNSKLKVHDNTTKEELIAEVTEKVMGSQSIVRGANVSWSKSEQIRILKTSHPRFSIRKYPHIETYNCILYYPETTTKEELDENASKIASTWCPKASVVWASSDGL